MSRLPTLGSDDGVWGQILNDYLLQSHNADGSLRNSASYDLKTILAKGNDANALNIANLADPNNNQDAATKKYVDDNSGGGSQPEDELPTSDPTGVTLDTTTYDNPVTQGPDKLRVLVFPAAPSDGSQVINGWAIEGDAFPRGLYFANAGDGADFGDGTTDPWNGRSAGWSVVKNGDQAGNYKYIIVAACPISVGEHDDNIGNHLLVQAGPVRVSELGGTPRAAIHSYTGDPNGQVGGNLGDVCIVAETDSGAWLYRCTTAGDASSAVWVDGLAG